MADPFSLVLLAIYTLIVLVVLVYFSTIVAGLLLASPVLVLLLAPEKTTAFLLQPQFNLAGVPFQNIHLLFFIWTALLTLIVYSEFIIWYLTPKKEEEKKEKEEEEEKTLKSRVEGVLLRIGKIMSG